MDVMFLVLIVPMFSFVIVGAVGITIDEWTCSGLSTRYDWHQTR